jgi:hypothetical protein
VTEKSDAAHIADMDKLSYYELYKLRRFAPVGHPYFSTLRPAIWKHFQERMEELDPGDAERVRISKEIGW